MRRGIHIGDRKYHGRMFKACFLGKDAVDWLVKNGHADSRKKAMMMGQALFVMKLLQHVTDDHSFKVPRLTDDQNVMAIVKSLPSSTHRDRRSISRYLRPLHAAATYRRTCRSSRRRSVGQELPIGNSADF
jgi:hypothetical protein